MRFMLISTKGRYAMRMMLDICLHSEDGWVHMCETSEREGISQNYLEVLAHPLLRAGLLQSKHGKKGGYRLGKDPQDILAGDVLRIVEGTTGRVGCSGPECSRTGKCALFDLWTGLDAVIEEYVDSVTLADLAKSQATCR